ncbi:unnamed protein product [Closterium sp. NIES-53]
MKQAFFQRLRSRGYPPNFLLPLFAAVTFIQREELLRRARERHLFRSSSTGPDLRSHGPLVLKTNYTPFSKAWPEKWPSLHPKFPPSQPSPPHPNHQYLIRKKDGVTALQHGPVNALALPTRHPLRLPLPSSPFSGPTSLVLSPLPHPFAPLLHTPSLSPSPSSPSGSSSSSIRLRPDGLHLPHHPFCHPCSLHLSLPHPLFSLCTRSRPFPVFPSSSYSNCQTFTAVAAAGSAGIADADVSNT